MILPKATRFLVPSCFQFFTEEAQYATNAIEVTGKEPVIAAVVVAEFIAEVKEVQACTILIVMEFVE